MFSLVPYARRREDAFSQLAKSFHTALNDDFFAPVRNAKVSFRTDVGETDKAYLIEAELPGFAKEDITIEYLKPYLTIKAVRSESKSEENKERQTLRSERRYGEYARKFYIEDVGEGGIQATLKDGVLTLEVPKAEKPQASRIEIREGA